MPIRQRSTQHQVPVTHLVHDRCKRENVRLLGTCLPLQYLWRRPLSTIAAIRSYTTIGFRKIESRDYGQAKIRDVCMARVVNKDVRLTRCRYSDKTTFIMLRTPSRFPCITLHEWM
jgi:hypothetical protein